MGKLCVASSSQLYARDTSPLASCVCFTQIFSNSTGQCNIPCEDTKYWAEIGILWHCHPPLISATTNILTAPPPPRQKNKKPTEQETNQTQMARTKIFPTSVMHSPMGSVFVPNNVTYWDEMGVGIWHYVVKLWHRETGVLFGAVTVQ